MFKIVLMGPSKSGKTTIFKNINGPFIYVENIRMMLGVDFYELKYEHHNVLAKISLWDINSHPRFLSLYPQFIRGAKAFVVVFNLMRRETFENV
jgi:GTPase SAR1 family protein